MRIKAFTHVLLVVGAVIIVMSIAGLSLVYIDRTNHGIMVMSGTSMEPTINDGDTVKIKLEVDVREIYAASKYADPPGDILAFRSPSGRRVAHRAIERIVNIDGSYSFKTQGDANSVPDAWEVRESHIIGKVTEIDPPFWTYSYVSWVVIIATGIATMLAGVVLIVVSHRKRGEVQRAPIIAEPKVAGKFFCRYCGKENKSDAVYCEGCGKKIA